MVENDKEGKDENVKHNLAWLLHDLEVGYERCCDCGGMMEWCSVCNMWTKTCCVDYGTCMCS